MDKVIKREHTTVVICEKEFDTIASFPISIEFLTRILEGYTSCVPERDLGTVKVDFAIKSDHCREYGCSIDECLWLTISYLKSETDEEFLARSEAVASLLSCGKCKAAPNIKSGHRRGDGYVYKASCGRCGSEAYRKTLPLLVDAWNEAQKMRRIRTTLVGIK